MRCEKTRGAARLVEQVRVKTDPSPTVKGAVPSCDDDDWKGAANLRRDPTPGLQKPSGLNCTGSRPVRRGAGLPQDLWRGDEARAGSLCTYRMSSAGRDSVEDVVREPDRLECLVWWRRFVGVATGWSSPPVAGASRGRASRLQGPWVMDRNAGTRTRPPVCSAPASSSESSDGRARGRSSRSSRRSGKPATWRRGAGTS